MGTLSLAKLLREKGITNLGSIVPENKDRTKPENPKTGTMSPFSTTAYDKPSSVTPAITTATKSLEPTLPVTSTQDVQSKTLASLDTPPTSDINTSIGDIMSQLNAMKGELGNLTPSTPQVSASEQQGIDLQNQIMQNISGAMPELEDSQTIMERFQKREDDIKAAAETAKGLTSDMYNTAIGEEKEEGQRILTAQEEARRGFATNTALFKQIEDTTKSRVNDLMKQRDNALVVQDMNTADSLNDLIVQEQESITSARKDYLNSLFSLSQEVRAQRSFETPEQTRTAEFTNAFNLLTQEKGIDWDNQQQASLQNIKTQYANIPGINTINTIEEAIGMIGPEIQQDVDLQRQLLRAQIQQQQVAMMASMNSSGGEQLPSSQIVMLSDANFLPTMLDDLEASINENEGLFGAISGRVPFSTSRDKINAQLKMVSQLVGKFMEGGVLRKEDEEKYAKMLPQLTDLNTNVSLSKLKSVRDMLSMKYNGYLTDFANSGYDTSGFGQIDFSEGKLAVLNKETGQTGYLDPSDFDPSIYDVLK